CHRRVRGVLVRAPKGQWGDEALVSTDATLPDWLILTGYCRRWSVEVAFCDAKQQLGFHDPQVWSAAAVERATPMAWLLGTLVVLWYAEGGKNGEQARRGRAWYPRRRGPEVWDTVGACPRGLWGRVPGRGGGGAGGAGGEGGA